MRSHLSRADLLQALQASGRHPQLQTEVAEAFGFKKQSLSPESTIAMDADQAPGETHETQLADNNEGVLYRPKREQRYWYVESCQPRRHQVLETGEWPEIEKKKPPDAKPLAAHPLRTVGQWQNLWDTVLTGRRRSRRIDVKRSLPLLTRCEPVRDLPRCERASFNRPVVILLERSEALYPIWPDLDTAWKTLSTLLGKRALHAYTLDGGPNNAWRCLHRRGRGSEHDIPEASQVIFVGSFTESEGDILRNVSEEWLQLIRRLLKAGHRTALISAYPLRQAPCPVYTLEPGSSENISINEACEVLLTAIAHHCLPKREELRHLRHALPGSGVGVELDVWQHPQILAQDGYLQFADQAASYWRQRADSLITPALEQALKDCRDSQDGVAREMSKLQYHLDDKEASHARHYPQLQLLGREAAEHRAHNQQRRHPQIILRSLLPGLCELADSNPGKDWRRLLTEAQYVAMQVLEPQPLKDQGLEAGEGHCYLFQQGQQLRLTAEPASRQLPLLKLNTQPYCSETRSTLAMNCIQGHNKLELADLDFSYQLNTLLCPTWAKRVWRSREGVFAEHGEGAVFHLEEAGPDQPQSHWRLIANPWPWAQTAGVDEHGLWAEFVIGQARQRLRWIPPGSFLMGSPEEEEGRDDDEIQHSVTLTQGYWLGETSCTQALWQAVTGDNPSHHKGEALPVEQISWDDSGLFIERLNKQLPGLQLSLPTEAQWEYACRAGKQTPYWWGEKMDVKYANNNRGQTVVEANYPANAFGLRSMSGNVREWCLDRFGDYAKEAVTDPTGPVEGHERVLRGGGWLLDGRLLRSAYRLAASPDSRGDSFGLRLAGGQDPQASERARPMSADRLEQSVRRSGTHGAGEGRDKGAR